MPEQLTKHPDVTLQVLRSAGARCGEGGPAQILKTCPAQRFCKLPGGEICVYGIDDAAAMTQLTRADWQALAAATHAQAAPARDAPPMAGGWLWLVLALLAGLVLGVWTGRRSRRGA